MDTGCDRACLVAFEQERIYVGRKSHFQGYALRCDGGIGQIFYIVGLEEVIAFVTHGVGNDHPDGGEGVCAISVAGLQIGVSRGH